MKRTSLFILLTMLLGLSLACNFLSGGNQSPPPAPTAVSGSNGEATAPAPATNTETPPTTPAPETNTETPPTAPPAENNGTSGEFQDVAALTVNYRLRIHVAWQPEGQDAEVTDMLIERTIDPDAEHFLITSPDGDFDTYRIGTQYTMCSADGCFSMSDSEASPMFESTDTTLPFISNPDADMKKIGTEKINGIKTTHYQIKFSAAAIAELASGDVSNIQSEAWVAENYQGFPSFVMRWTATWDEVRDGVSGKSTVNYEVSDLGADFTIAPPDNSTTGNVPDDVPIYSNAQQSLSMGGMMVYTTTDDVQTVTDFYAQELPNQGWTLDSDGSMTGMTMQTWTKGDRSLQLLITLDESNNTTSIMLTLQ